MKAKNIVFFALFVVGLASFMFVMSAACTTLDAPPKYSAYVGSDGRPHLTHSHFLTLGDLPWWTFVLASGVVLGWTRPVKDGWEWFRDKHFAKLFE